MGSTSVPPRMSKTTRRRSRYGSTGVALVALTVALASAGCSAAADRAAFVGGTGARTLLSASARASCVPMTRRPGARESGEGAQRGCCECLGVLSFVPASMCCRGVCVLLEIYSPIPIVIHIICSSTTVQYYWYTWSAGTLRAAVPAPGAVPGVRQDREYVTGSSSRIYTASLFAAHSLGSWSPVCGVERRRDESCRPTRPSP